MSIIYVSQNATGLNNGDSWQNAYSDLQSALNIALSGDVIWVARGNYTPGNDREDTFNLKNGVSIYGGFNGSETQLEQRNINNNLTVLSGEIGNPNDNTDNSYHVVTAENVDTSTILDGFTVTRGNANRFIDNDGGGIFTESGNPTFRNLVITDNRADATGGGFFNADSNPILINVTFQANEAGDGGGMYNRNSNPQLTNVNFNNNKVVDVGAGGGLYNRDSSPILTNVNFIGNIAVDDGDGAGMFLEGDSNPVLKTVVFDGNIAEGNGGGIATNSLGNKQPVLIDVIFQNNQAGDNGGGFYGADASPLINVSFLNNTAGTDGSGNGGGMYNPSAKNLTNVLFAYNTASNDGGGMYNTEQGDAVVTNATFIGNSAGVKGGAIRNAETSTGMADPIVRNSIIWANNAPEGSQIYNHRFFSGSVSNSIVQGDYEGKGNQNVDPQFLEDFTLQSTSPAINIGDNAALPVDIYDINNNGNTSELIPYDLNNGNRIVGGTVDLGVNEFGSNPTNPPDPDSLLQTPIYRFQNRNQSGTYLFAGEEESNNIRQSFPEFEEEGFAFFVGAQANDDLLPMYRFHNDNVPGTYLYAGESESDNIRQNFPNFRFEGVAFYVYGAGSNQANPFYRFQNTQVLGTYIFVGQQERQNILANFPTFVEEGIAFEVD